VCSEIHLVEIRDLAGGDPDEIGDQFNTPTSRRILHAGDPIPAWNTLGPAQNAEAISGNSIVLARGGLNGFGTGGSSSHSEEGRSDEGVRDIVTFQTIPESDAPMDILVTILVQMRDWFSRMFRALPWINSTDSHVSDSSESSMRRALQEVPVAENDDLTAPAAPPTSPDLLSGDESDFGETGSTSDEPNQLQQTPFSFAPFQCEGPMASDEAEMWKVLGQDDRLSCYCSQQPYMVLAKNKKIRKLCADHLWKLFQQTVSFVFGSLVIVVMNWVLESCLTKMCMWAKPLSITLMHARLMWRLFILEFVNTSVVILLVNSKFSDEGDDDGGLGVLGQGNYRDFEFGWYVDVGIGIVLTMFFHIFGPHCGYFLIDAMKKRTRPFFLKSRAKTDEDIKDLYTQSEFDLATRYSNVLTCVFVTMMYCSAIPLLLVRVDSRGK